MRYLFLAGLIVLLCTAAAKPAKPAATPPPKPAAVAPAQPADIRAAHREAARKTLGVLDKGAILRGDVDQNGSKGTFEAFFYDGSWLIREKYGAIVDESYFGPEGAWAGGNTGLPYEVDAHDSPANSVFNLLSNGEYLDDKYWDYFTYVGEEAGGYRFRFAPPDLPPIQVVIYSDETEPWYLQIESAEVALAPEDPKSIRSRHYYQYAKNAAGDLYSVHETGRDVDQDGRTVTMVDYKVTDFTITGSKPEQLHFDTARTPVGAGNPPLAAPVSVPVTTNFGYFIVPVTFKNGQTLNFILDTGASASMFAPDAVTASGVDSSVNTVAYGHGTKLEFEMGLVDGAALGTSTTGLAPLAPFLATKLPSSSREVLDALQKFQCAGILGVSPFYQYVITLDYANKNLVVNSPATFDPNKSLTGPHLSYTLDVEDLIYAKGRLNDTLVGQIALDTGLQQDLALLRETMDGAGLKFNKVGEQMNTVVGGNKEFDYVAVPSFDLGPLRLEGKIATMTEDPRGNLTARKLLGFLGLSLFSQARVTLDLFAQRMYLEPPAELAKQMQEHAPDLFQGLVDDKYTAPHSAAPMPFGGPGADISTPAMPPVTPAQPSVQAGNPA